MEVNTTINHVDITIHRTPKNWTTSIYKKPTFTDTIIPFTSNHPTQHKCATVKFLYNGLTLRRLMSYIYMEHPFLMFLDHTQRRSTVGRTPLDE